MSVAVVGAGISGLSVAHFLRRHQIESTVFEAADRPGGVIRTDEVNGRLVERGPHRTRLTGTVRELIADVGLGDEVVEAADVPLFVYRDGRLGHFPRSLTEAIGTDLLSTRGKLRVLLEPYFDPPRSGETVHQYLVRAFGREFAENVAGPVYGGLYGTHPDEMDVDRTLGRAFEEAGIDGSVLFTALKRLLRRQSTPPAITFERGMRALPQALYDRYAGAIELATPVRRIESLSGGYEVTTGEGAVRVEDVVLTTPAVVAADLLEKADAATASALRRLTYNPLAAVSLIADADLTGAGYQVPFDEPLHTLGATWDDCLFGRDGLYTVYLGGGKAPSLVDRSDDWLGATAAREFELVTGESARPIDVHRLRPGMPAFDTTWSALDAVDPPPGIHLCTNYTSRAGVPGRVQDARRLARSLANDEGDSGT